jgi:Nucleotidyl transferase AbiEii toxin, Type IV TA system
METLRTPQITELFHVAFLDVLSKRLDPARYVLKGGANLRYYFGSLRYSEDIDLDVEGIPAWRLTEKIDDVLSSVPMEALLRAGELGIAESSNPKHSETTQRWKIGLEAPGHSQLIRTKIEFSYRGSEGQYRLEPIPRRIVTPYALSPPVVQHYVDDTPTEQKVLALAGRSETQARDVFDLDLLLRQRSLPTGSLDPAVLTEAADLALQLPYAAFHDQVLPFLEPGTAELYEGETPWEGMQAFVAEKLEEAK